jgi:hypothetical protein
MFAHRFREHFHSRLDSVPGAATSPVLAGVPTAGANGTGNAFVACPLSGFGASPLAHSQIREIYRIAAERTNEQLRRTWSRRPQFSVN